MEFVAWACAVSSRTVPRRLSWAGPGKVGSGRAVARNACYCFGEPTRLRPVVLKMECNGWQPYVS
jgi:hypothetical protein